jgi:hypothetical protein
VLGAAGRLALPGVAVGAVASLALAGLLRGFVFGIEPRSAWVLFAVSAGMVLVTLVATAPSALRAMRVDARRSVG